MNCQYIEALVLETLRHFTVLPLSLPRLTTKAIRYKDFVIPKETHLFMNAYSANHDCQIFVNPINLILIDGWIQYQIVSNLSF